MNIREQARSTPVIANTDVLVVGAGPAGIIAAVAAARNGAKTILVESQAFPGGCAAMGLPLVGFYNDNRKRIVGGIPWELVENLKKIKASPGPWLTNPSLKYQDSMVVFDLPVFRTVVYKMLSKSGVNLLLHTLAAVPIMAGNRIKGIIIESKAGRQAILAKITIDATGDGDIAARAGAPFEKGHPQSAFLQPGTLLFEALNVDMDALLKDVAKHPDDYHIHSKEAAARYLPEYRRGVRMQISGLEKLCRKAAAAGDYDVPNPYVIFVCLPREGTLLVNMAKVKGVDGTDNQSLSDAETEGCENIGKVMQFLKKYVSGMKNAQVGWIAPSIGIRETRRIVGQYTLTEQDMRARLKFEDRIAMGGRYIDIHDPKPGAKEAYGKVVIPRTFPDGYFIPFGCLVPPKIRNLLTAGRCISVSYAAYGSTRVMAQCMATGQAAGTAAALAAAKNGDVKNTDVKHLQEILKEQGALLE